MDTIEKKLSTLSSIPEKSLVHFHQYLNDIHSHDIVTQMLEGKDIFELETFEGKLHLILEDDTVRYKFIPNDTFNRIVVDTIVNKKSNLVEDLSSKLKEVLVNTYKDLL